MTADHCAVCEMPGADHLDWCTPQARANARYDPMSRDELIAKCKELHEHIAWFKTYVEACDNEVKRSGLRTIEANLELDAALMQLQGLQAKGMRQRRELRRLNKTLRAIWDGVRFDINTTAKMREQASSGAGAPTND